MSAAVKDLPDPLDTSPAMATSNPDDLLAKMADEAIDRLMADADKGASSAAPTPPVPMDAVAPAAEPPATPSPTTGPASSSLPSSPVPSLPVQADSASASLARAGGALTVESPAGGPVSHAAVTPVVPAPVDAAAADFSAAFRAELEVDDAVAVRPSFGAAAPVEAPAVAPTAPPPAADLKALLQDSAAAHKPSPLLLPLAWINAPFAGLSDHARRVFGLLGVVTLVPAAAAIFYVVWLKRHLG